MARQAFIIGGTGQIGRAVADNLLAHGWDVTLSHRGRRPPRWVAREFVLKQTFATELRANGRLITGG
jgi:NAD(P)-dependent dehydrogenase (short-subunit alcohol dehydrogenase family)